MVKDILGLQFNPGEAMPTYFLAQWGISILTCHPKSAHEVETIKDYKEHNAQQLIPCNSMRSGTARKRHQALYRTTTLSYK